MGADDDADCAGHWWLVAEVALLAGGGWVVYECALCGAVLTRLPGESFPR
jgi:hypothetical protein